MAGQNGRILLTDLMFLYAQRLYVFLPKLRFRIPINHPSILAGQAPVVVGV
jgi:hypothetical protein